MKSRNLFFLSILAGLLAVILVQVQLRAEKGRALIIFRATASVGPGEALGDRIEKVTLPGENLFPNLLKEAPTGEMEALVSDTPLLEAIRAGEIVLFRHLENAVDPGLGTEIPAGMKAISLEVDEETSVSYLVEPSDRVDVLAALPRAVDLPAAQRPVSSRPESSVNLLDQISDTPTKVVLETRPILQGARVLAVGRRYRRSHVEDLGRDDYRAVTLLVSLQEAQKLAYVRDVLGSPLTLVLRSSDDVGSEPMVRPVALDSPDFDQLGNS